MQTNSNHRLYLQSLFKRYEHFYYFTYQRRIRHSEYCQNLTNIYHYFNAAIAKVSTVTGIVQHVAQNQIISNYKAGGDVLEAMKDFKSLGGLRKVNKVFQRIGYAGLVVDYAQLGSKIYNNQAKTSDYLRTGISTALTLVAISNPVGIIAVGAYGVWDYYYGDEFWKETGIDYN
ncbi:MAG: hypothetical protein H7196_02695 [candidate division SR1 bacterium]|nr:hypothetical protein [candidate division SR1 bacterium]